MQNEIIELIKKLEHMESVAIPTYTRHLESAMVWSGLSRRTQQQIGKYLEQLRTNSSAYAEQIQKFVTDSQIPACRQVGVDYHVP